MAKHKTVKHSKYKNTGFIFELLTRQITLEILNNSDDEVAKSIVQEFFSGKTQLAKELRLFNLLLNEKYNSTSKAEKFIELVTENRNTLDEIKLSREKYNLIKSIKENFDISQFLSSPVSNYKVLASIHKLFESKKHGIGGIKDIFDSKYTIVEHISSKSPKNVSKTTDLVVEDYKKQEKDLRLLTYKILVESFNKKYTNLNVDQKSILKEYINNVNNTSKFGTFYKTKVKSVITELHSMHKSMSDTVTKIKLRETIHVLKKQKIGRKISDNQVSSLMMSYELIKEIQNVEKQRL